MKFDGQLDKLSTNVVLVWGALGKWTQINWLIT